VGSGVCVLRERKRVCMCVFQLKRKQCGQRTWGGEREKFIDNQIVGTLYTERVETCVQTCVHHFRRERSLLTIK
jgi:hypothetical protein